MVSRILMFLCSLGPLFKVSGINVLTWSGECRTVFLGTCMSVDIVVVGNLIMANMSYL